MDFVTLGCSQAVAVLRGIRYQIPLLHSHVRLSREENGNDVARPQNDNFVTPVWGDILLMRKKRFRESASSISSNLAEISKFVLRIILNHQILSSQLVVTYSTIDI